MRHLFQLYNDSDSAWTTGPYLAVSGGRPLSEDILKYTPKGGQVEIAVSAAINIANSKSESESDRKLKEYQPDRSSFWDLVTLSGELKLQNFEKYDADIVIQLPVSGKPTQANNDGQLVTDPDRLRLLERTGTISWAFTLKPKEAKSLTYSYERYVPSR